MAMGDSGDPLPHLRTDAIRALVGATSAERGFDIAARGGVQRLAYNADTLRLTAAVQGTAPQPYRLKVRLQDAFGPEGEPLMEPTAGRCTCPVGEDCKHVAAALYEVVRRDADGALDHARRALADMVTTADTLQSPTGVHPSPGGRTEGPGDDVAWRSVLEPLAGMDAPRRQASPPPLAIGVELVAESSRNVYQQWGPAPAGEEHLREERPLYVVLRPLRRGAKGSWIKGGLTWRAFQFPRAEYEPAQERALRLVWRQLQAEDSYPTDAWIGLHAFDSPRIWQLLAEAREAGVELVPLGVLGDVVLDPPVSVGLDVARAEDGALEVAPSLTPAEPGGRVHAVGSIGFYRVVEEDDATWTLHLVPSARTVPEAVQRMVLAGAPVRVPAADREEFLGRVYPRLRGTLEVASADGSVELPEFEPPVLRLQADFRPDHRLVLRWSWLYFDPPRELGLTDPDALRDPRHEDAVLRAAAEVWPRAGRAEEQELTGVGAARFSESVLPRLQQVDHLRVDVHGDRPDYRELTAAPRIEVSTTPARNDWFDLGVQVSVDGHVLPFVELFTALVRGETTLMLADGTWLGLDHPAFDRLRALLSEAATLQEWTPENTELSRHQVGFWEELKEIADDVDEDPAWTEAVGRLARVESLPPAPEVPGLLATLRPYQQEGLRWLSFLYHQRLGGILADDMGLGKTVQTLALIAHARAEDPAAPPFLVVAPSSVVSVWASEAATFTPGLDVRVLDTTTRRRGTTVAEEAAGADVVVTSYTLLRIDAAQHGPMEWGGVVLDEAQFLKNRTSKVHTVARDLQAPFRLAITGTPLENSLTDLWALLDVVVPGLFPSHRRFREAYVNPIENGEDPGRMAALRRRVRPFMLRRSKELVAKDLPPKQEQVLRVELEASHRKVYDRVLARERRKVLGLLGDMDGNRFTIFKSLTLLRMLALAPRIVDEEYASVPSSKLERFLDDLTEVLREGHRVIVFSQFTSFLRVVAEELEAMEVEHAYLDGSTRNRSEVIEGFRQGEAPVFLISLKAGGFGLTLTEADYVFLMDPWWNPAAEAQAVDRAHRIGQERTVMVYRMVAEGTIEEKVLELQRRKAELFGALVDESDDSGAGAFTESLTADDIRALLSTDA
ncbi:DEAD/DEAH box helicase [Micrococcus sp.]|uniref:DEAD/DEAH box helicase n=1 Tax=Micrococcus sp. TaxID=1271 RepID=UPI002A91CF07|nr:DEAD/DEAH box helicase [Micrococcus sp.]MDY6054982.1 DEAD/DEAH box helicase [Micrococcus sp.]